MAKIIISILILFSFNSEAQPVALFNSHNYTSGPVGPVVLGEDSVKVAYSVRLVNSAYSGYCMKVRRSSDNTEQDIGFVSGNLDTASLKTFVGAGSGYVSKWYDQSSLGNDAAQTTNATQPRIVNAGVVDRQGARPTIVFSGAQSLGIASKPLFGITSLTFLAVANFSTVNNFEMFFTQTDGVPANNIFEFRRNGVANTMQFLLSTNSSAGTANINAQKLISIFGSGASSPAYINGVADGVPPNGAVVVGNHVATIGARHNATLFFVGNTQEIIIYYANNVLSKSTLESNINTHYTIY